MKFLLILIISASIVASIGLFLFFNQSYTETLMICAQTYDEMMDLAIIEEDVAEISQKYELYKCKNNIDDWKHLTKHEVVRNV